MTRPIPSRPRVHSAARLALICMMLSGCGWFSSKDDESKNDSSKIPVEDLYNNGIDALHQDRYAAAVKQFDAVEQNYPYSSWATNAQLMQGYSQYKQEHYTEAIATLDHFIQLHPASRDIAYAYYLRALCFYEQIADIQRDQKTTEEAMTALQKW